MGYRSVHFGITKQELVSKIKDGCIPHITDSHKIAFKRKATTDISHDIEDNKPVSRDMECQTDNSCLYCLEDVIEVIKTIGRDEDFIGLLNGIMSGRLLDNIAFHLLLDVGRFFSLSSINLMRYPKETLNFWVTVKNLFKGKGISFFRGYKGDGARNVSEPNKCISPNDCRVNFIVPCDDILRKESAPFLADAAQPGILHTSLNSFADNNKGKDVKISIDGKKLAYGFGKLGDEDLCGYEQHPTLTERKNKHESHISTVDTTRKVLKSLSTSSTSMISPTSTADVFIPQEDYSTMKNALLLTISNLSERIRELRQLVLKKENALANLMKQVEGDWRSCNVAPAISYNKTKIMQCQSSIRDLLASVDSIGYIIACINGTAENYIRGQVDVFLDSQSNYLCLRDVNGDRRDLEPCYTKQRTERWHEIRNNSRVTGSTLFKALGFETLKQQQLHYDKVFRGISPQITEETQALFDHGEREEINAVATLVGKIIPVYYPNLVFREDGCEVLKLNDSSVVVSGDGSGMNNEKKTEVAFEFKCPKPGKRYVTDVHYSLPLRYTTQIISQMAAKECPEFGYVCYTKESSTFITGKQDNDLWNDTTELAKALYGSDNVSRPTKIKPVQKEMRERLKKYSETTTFLAEFPSVIGIKCSCSPLDTFDEADIFGCHGCRKEEDLLAQDKKSFILECHLSLDIAVSVLNEAYELLRRPAKEILVTVISDLDRTHVSNSLSNYAVPVHYALPGFSLPMSPVRGIIKSIAEEIEKKDMNLKVIAFDGQFLEIALSDDEGRPLTLCKLMKKYWENSSEDGQIGKGVFSSADEFFAEGRECRCSE